jgi:HSP20 family protein
MKRGNFKKETIIMTYKNLFPIQPNSYNKPDHYNTDYPFFTIGKDMNEFLNPLNPDFFENSFIDFRPLKQDRFPKVDIAETKEDFLITADLPGIDEKNVNITLDDGILTIKGEKKTGTEDKQGEFYSRERSYGVFQRSFEVPAIINENKIGASFSNGVLKVKMPKTPEAKKEVKKILINS